MKIKQKEPFVPSERHETIRREIILAIEGKEMSALNISAYVGISVRDVYGHLEHIQKTINKRDSHLNVTPARCRECGFIFRKRERLKKPGKCPVCDGESIEEPLFSIEKKV